MDEALYQSRHKGPYTPMFVGSRIHLIVGGLTLDVVRNAVTRPAKTWVKEVNDSEIREVPGSLAGVVYGTGYVEMSRSQAHLELDGDIMEWIPHGKFEALSGEEREACITAKWKFSFDYSLPPSPLPIG